MTDTFTLTGRILGKSKRPVVGAQIIVIGNPAVLSDPASFG